MSILTDAYRAVLIERLFEVGRISTELKAITLSEDTAPQQSITVPLLESLVLAPPPLAFIIHGTPPL
jgi:hypothetical protein